MKHRDKRRKKKKNLKNEKESKDLCKKEKGEKKHY